MQYTHNWKNILRGILAVSFMFVLLGCGRQTEEKLLEVKRLIADVQKEHSLDKAQLKHVVVEGMEQYLHISMAQDQLHLSYGLSKNLKPYGLLGQTADDMVTIIGRVTPQAATVGQDVNGIFAEIDCSTNKVYALGVIRKDSVRHYRWKSPSPTLADALAEQKARLFLFKHFKVKDESLVRINRREWIRGRFMFWDKATNTSYVVAIDEANRITGFHRMADDSHAILIGQAPFL
ncbi:hypothetical protein [Paenibacillus taiwanensis]|uniref:hypothetical protein n=1 Tax=Paenibacillus taiwanensis TaxID=401638 RepID=UPI0004153585|nr:hypothetical protein [Paenibacillus taiwanensis]